MGYTQTATSEQATLFAAEEHTTQRKHAGVPIYRVALVKEGRVPCYTQQIRSSASASAILQEYLADVDREHFVVLLLNQKNKVIGIHTVSIGSLSSSIVHMRETFKAAILANAASIICAHNHPSGDPQPSQEDRAITKRLKDAGTLLGINLLDHVVIGDDKYFSFADEGIL